MTGLGLFRADLHDVDFCGSDMTEINLSHADLRGRPGPRHPHPGRVLPGQLDRRVPAPR
ncbi:MAG: pentapeptide repeat-containing protein [Caldilineaceae bacterium]